MASRYTFAQIFSFDVITRQLTPIYNIRINGALYFKDMPLLSGTNFGKLSPYENSDKDVAGVWDKDTQIMEIIGYY